MSVKAEISRRAFVTGLSLVGLGPRSSLAQGFAGLGADASGFAAVVPGRRFVFPKYNPTPESGPKARVVLNWFAALRRLASAGK